MKKIVIILISIFVILAFAACSYEENAEESNEETTEEVLQEQEKQNPELENISEDKYLNEEKRWDFGFAIKNTTEEKIFIKYMVMENVYLDGATESETFTPENFPQIFEDMDGFDDETGAILPEKHLFWGDGHPGKSLLKRTYRFVFEGESATEYTATYEYNLIMEIGEQNLPEEYLINCSTGNSDIVFEEVKPVPADEKKDLEYIRHNADFEVEIAEGVFWIPMKVLGGSDITNDEIVGILEESPEIKQEKIDTLYEAIQLFQIGEFYFTSDNIRIDENGISWEHHKPGYNAVVTNNGCCATCSNWLNYILKDDYDEVGFVAFSERDGSGHIYNYIKQDGWYYFVDMTHQTVAWEDMALESGNIKDFYSSDYVLGNLLKVKNLEDYIEFYLENTGYPFGLMFMYMAENCLALDGLVDGDIITITYETVEGVELNVIYDDPNDNLFWQQIAGPTKYPEW